jgi:hypothetical protein
MSKSQSQRPVQPPPAALLWRFLLTIVLLLILAGSGITTFKHVTNAPETRILPTITYDSESSLTPYMP